MSFLPQRCQTCMNPRYPGLLWCATHAKKHGARLYNCSCHCFPHPHRPLGKKSCIWPSPETRPKPQLSNDEIHARYREDVSFWTPYAALDEDDRAKVDARLGIMMKGRGGRG